MDQFEKKQKLKVIAQEMITIAEQGNLNEWEKGFVADVKTWLDDKGWVTTRQAEILVRTVFKNSL